MNRYYMNEAEITGDIVAKGASPNPSEYQGLIDDYLAGGGVIQVIPEGVRVKPGFDVDNYYDARDYVDYTPKIGGKTLMDQIEGFRVLPQGLKMGESFNDH